VELARKIFTAPIKVHEQQLVSAYDRGLVISKNATSRS
jgi:hypothetical protein